MSDAANIQGITVNGTAMSFTTATATMKRMRKRGFMYMEVRVTGCTWPAKVGELVALQLDPGGSVLYGGVFLAMRNSPKQVVLRSSGPVVLQAK